MKVDPIRLEVEIRFDDGDLMWARYADLRLAKSHRKLSSTERCRACLKDHGDLKVSRELTLSLRGIITWDTFSEQFFSGVFNVSNVSLQFMGKFKRPSMIITKEELLRKSLNCQLFGILKFEMALSY